MGRWVLLSGAWSPPWDPSPAMTRVPWRESLARGFWSGDLPCSVTSSLFWTLGFSASLRWFGCGGHGWRFQEAGWAQASPWRDTFIRVVRGVSCYKMTHAKVLCKTIKGHISYCYQRKSTRTLWARYDTTPQAQTDVTILGPGS